MPCLVLVVHHVAHWHVLSSALSWASPYWTGSPRPTCIGRTPWPMLGKSHQLSHAPPPHCYRCQGQSFWTFLCRVNLDGLRLVVGSPLTNDDCFRQRQLFGFFWDNCWITLFTWYGHIKRGRSKSQPAVRTSITTWAKKYTTLAQQSTRFQSCFFKVKFLRLLDNFRRLSPSLCLPSGWPNFKKDDVFVAETRGGAVMMDLHNPWTI